MNKKEEALEYWKKAVEYNPKNTDAKISLANAYLKTGDIQNAIRKIRSAYKENKKDIKILLMYGALLLNNNEYFEALEKLDEALKINPDYEIAKFAKTECLIKMGKIEEAESILGPLEEKEELKDTNDILYLRALINEYKITKSNNLELIDETIKICDKIISLHNETGIDSKILAIKNNLIKIKEN